MALLAGLVGKREEALLRKLGLVLFEICCKRKEIRANIDWEVEERTPNTAVA